MVQSYARTPQCQVAPPAPEQAPPDFGSNAAVEAGPDTAPESTPFLDAAEGEVSALGDTHEHIGVGGTDGVTINGVDYTTGEISALPDFVPSVLTLYGMDEARLLEIRGALERKLADPASVADAEWMKLFGQQFADLTFANADHFGTMDAMSGDLAGTNVGTWAEQHEDALGLAATAAHGGDPELQQRALATEAFASHYLADAFSAGHLFDKGEVVEATGQIDPVTRKLRIAAAANQVFADHQDEIADYQIFEGAWAPFGAVSFAGLLELADVVQPEGFDNAPSGAIHDDLSRTGVPVENDEDAWVMMGDDRMDERSEAFATEATQRARDEVLEVAGGGDPTDHHVTGLVPRPTEQGAQQVEATVERYQSDEGLLEGVVQQLGKQVTAILDGAATKLPLLVRAAPEGGLLGKVQDQFGSGVSAPPPIGTDPYAIGKNAIRPR